MIFQRRVLLKKYLIPGFRFGKCGNRRRLPCLVPTRLDRPDRRNWPAEPAESPQDQPVVRLVSSIRKLVASEESSVPVNFRVTDLPAYGVMSIVLST